MAVFDFHVHCFPAFLAERAVASMSGVAGPQTDGTWEGQLQYMAGHGIRRCTVLNMATTPASMHNVNLFAVESMRPGYAVFGSVHPQAENAIEELEWLYQSGIRGVKLHTGYQRFRLDDPVYFPLYRRIGELGMATVVHCGPFFKDRENLVFPSVVARVIDCFQGAPFVCAHMGGIHVDHPEFSILRDMPVYVDTALSPRLMKQERFLRAVQELGEKRVLFGTDMPWEDPERLIQWIDAALLPDPAIHAEALYYDNAVKLCEQLLPEECCRWQEQDAAENTGGEGKTRLPSGKK